MAPSLFSPPPNLGTEPDYRFSLANERTFLAWIRTSLALTGGGLAVIALLPEFALAWGREALGLSLVAFGTIVATTSFRRWYRNEVAMRQERTLPPSRLPLILSIGVGLVSLAALVLLLGELGR